VYKHGSNDVLNNYRTLAVVNIIRKTFMKNLNDILSVWCNVYEAIDESQRVTHFLTSPYKEVFTLN